MSPEEIQEVIDKGGMLIDLDDNYFQPHRITQEEEMQYVYGRAQYKHLKRDEWDAVRYEIHHAFTLCPPEPLWEGWINGFRALGNQAVYSGKLFADEMAANPDHRLQWKLQITNYEDGPKFQVHYPDGRIVDYEEIINQIKDGVAA